MNRGSLAPAAVLLLVAIGGCGSSGPTELPGSSLASTAESRRSASAMTTAPTSPPVTAAFPSPSPSAPAAPHIASVVATVDYGVGANAYPNAQEAVVGFGSLWIPFYASPHGWLLRIDIATHHIVARIPVGESPDSVAIAGNDVWVANTLGDGSRHYAGQNTLSRIDPATNRVVQTVTVQIGGPIAGGLGAVWVPNLQAGDGNGILHKVDAASGKVVASLPLTGRPAIGCGHLWVIDTIIAVEAPEVTVGSAVNPKTGQRIGTWPLIAPGMLDPQRVEGSCLTAWSTQDDSGQMTLGIVDPEEGVVRSWPTLSTRLRIIDGVIWATPDETSVKPIEPDGSAVADTLTLPIDPAAGGGWFTVTGGEGWVITNTAALALGRVLPPR